MVVGLMLPDAIPGKLLVEIVAMLDVLPPPNVLADVAPDAAGGPEVAAVLFPDGAAFDVADGGVAAEDGDEFETACGGVVLADCEREIQ